MPPQKKIDISLNPGYRFNPPSLPCLINDQIYWANSDTQVHWPALKRGDGTLDENYFLEPVTGPDGVKRNQLAPNSTSATFSPGVAGVLNYVCACHLTETGSINVLAHVYISANPQTGGPALYNINDLPPAPGLKIPLPVAVGSGVVWINNDIQAHWPAPVDDAGKIIDKYGFMTKAIPPGSNSQPYIVKAVGTGTINYGCVLHPGESGSLQIGEPE